MKIALDIGHNCHPDIGANGVRREDELNLEIGIRLKSYLKNSKHDVIGVMPFKVSSVRESLERRVATANIIQADRYISIHHNALNAQAYGTEVYIGSERGRRLAESILNEICALGFYNRGVKDGSDFYVLKNTTMPAVLVEVCFCDNQKDMAIWNADIISKAIAKGINNILQV